MMKCPVCNAEVAENEKYCPVCGAEIENQFEIENALPAKDPGKIMNIIALVLGISSLVLGAIFSCSCACAGSILPAILAVAGIVLGAIGIGKSKKAGFKGGLGMIGLILSIVAVVVMIVFVILNSVLGAILTPMMTEIMSELNF